MGTSKKQVVQTISSSTKTYAKDVADVTISNTTSEVELKSLFIKANTFKIGDALQLFAIFFRATSNNNVILRFRANTTNDLNGSPIQISTFTITLSQLYNIYRRVLLIKNATTNTQSYPPTVSLADDGASAGAAGVLAIDWTVDQYIMITAQMLGGSDTISANLFSITKY